MKEIGGYIELDTYHLPMLHEGAVALNCGRNALAYVLRAKHIQKIKIPYFLCDSVSNVCIREKVEISYYHVGLDFKPTTIDLKNDEWLYIVNYYGQITNEEIKQYAHDYQRIILDQSQAYFQMPIEGIDTLYTCRKWFGVADGAFLYTDAILNEELPLDKSHDRMHFLLGRYEGNASDFYKEYSDNNSFFASEPIKRMSKLTGNLLHGIDYASVEKRRIRNYEYLHSRLSVLNRLQLVSGCFMYPLMIENGARIRREMQKQKIYIPLLWPSVLGTTTKGIEYEMAENILPIPVDQRYDITDMEYIINILEGII